EELRSLTRALGAENQKAAVGLLEDIVDGALGRQRSCVAIGQLENALPGMLHGVAQRRLAQLEERRAVHGAVEHARDPELPHAVEQYEERAPFVRLRGRQLVDNLNVARARDDVAVANDGLTDEGFSHAVSGSVAVHGAATALDIDRNVSAAGDDIAITRYTLPHGLASAGRQLHFFDKHPRKVQQLGVARYAIRGH